MVKRMMLLGIVLSVIFQLRAQTGTTVQDTVPAGSEVLKNAATTAAGAGKNVFLMFHASWCGWCHRMDAAMADSSIKKYFDDNYVITHLTVQEGEENKRLENPGGQELFDKYTGGKQTGIPFWVILDKDQNVLANSFLPGGDNMGCPAAASEVDQFIKILRKTSKIDDQALVLIRERFKKNKAGH